MSSSVVILTSKWNGSNEAAGAIVAVAVAVVELAVSWCVPCGRRLETVPAALVRVNRSPSPFVCVVSRFFTCDDVDDDDVDEDDK
jgi:hypothetical protein